MTRNLTTVPPSVRNLHMRAYSIAIYYRPFSSGVFYLVEQKTKLSKSSRDIHIYHIPEIFTVCIFHNFVLSQDFQVLNFTDAS